MSVYIHMTEVSFNELLLCAIELVLSCRFCCTESCFRFFCTVCRLFLCLRYTTSGLLWTVLSAVSLTAVWRYSASLHLPTEGWPHTGLGQHSCCMPGTVSTWIGNHLWAGKPSWCTTNYPGQLSLAILLWVGAVSTSENLGSKQAHCKMH